VVPIPYYELLCDGTTDTTQGKYPYVIDMPENDPPPSNLALIIFHKNSSVNYNFEIKNEDKNWIPGETNIVHWKAWVIDTSKDAVAFITFADRAGNDTTIMLQYSKGVGVDEPSDINGYSMSKIKPNIIKNNDVDLEYSIGKSGRTTINIISSNGIIVKELANEFMEAGNYRIKIPIENIPNGMYFITLQSGAFKKVQKIIVQR
ncbi:MAG TPA: T9SS type A sorting domain-containing protein, partial [Bacteroidota bacterium]|nr:T9SS type A sorting domain-containing protein [Bacteroidota bacterium]